MSRARTVRKRVDAGELPLVHVRDRHGYDRGHVAGSVDVPVDELDAALTQLSADSRSVASTRGAGIRSPEAVLPASRSGLAASHIPNGLAGWTGLGLPLHHDPKETVR